MAVFNKRTGRLEEIYEVKASEDHIDLARRQLGTILSMLGEDVDAYVAVPKKNKFKVIKQDTVYAKALYRKNRIDMFKWICWVLAGITIVILAISIARNIQLTAIQFLLYAIILALILAPFVNEIKIGLSGINISRCTKAKALAL